MSRKRLIKIIASQMVLTVLLKLSLNLWYNLEAFYRSFDTKSKWSEARAKIWSGFLGKKHFDLYWRKRQEIEFYHELERHGATFLQSPSTDISSSKFLLARTLRCTSSSIRELLWLTIITSDPRDSSWIWKIRLDQWLEVKSHSDDSSLRVVLYFCIFIVMECFDIKKNASIGGSE